MYIARGAGGITPLVGMGNLPYIWLYGDSILLSVSGNSTKVVYLIVQKIVRKFAKDRVRIIDTAHDYIAHAYNYTI